GVRPPLFMYHPPRLEVVIGWTAKHCIGLQPYSSTALPSFVLPPHTVARSLPRPRRMVLAKVLDGYLEAHHSLLSLRQLGVDAGRQSGHRTRSLVLSQHEPVCYDHVPRLLQQFAEAVVVGPRLGALSLR